jgi:hypothetical protein
MIISRTLLYKLVLVAFLHVITFSYFIQGGGWNQAAYIGEIRSIVERGHFTLDEYGLLTGDVSVYKNRVFSNKTPSITFFAAPVYFLFYKGAVSFQVDVTSDSYQFLATEFITFFCAGVWGALFGLLVFFLLGECFSSLNENDKIFFAGMVPLSTMIFPYSTVAFVHSFETFWLGMIFYLFMRYLNRGQTVIQISLIAFSYGIAVLANPMLAVIAPFFYWMFLKSRDNPLKKCAVFSVMMLIPLIPLLVYDYINFEHFLRTNRSYQHLRHQDPGYFLGVFGVPHPERIFKVLFWGNRSLFPAQTYLLFFIPGLYFIVRDNCLSRPIMQLFSIVLLVFALFMSSFNGWQGGWCFGPRYITSVLIIFIIWSVPLYMRFKKTYALFMLASGIMMLIATSVDPIAGLGPELLSPFTDYLLPNFLKGNLSLNWIELFPSGTTWAFSMNMGQLWGLTGLKSLIPLLLFQGIIAILLIGQSASKKHERQ